MDWSTVGPLHVTDDEVVPGAVYDVQAIDCTCNFSDPANYSAPLTISTSSWADLVKDCTTTPCGPPDGVTGIATDVTAILDKYKNLPGNVIKARADIEGCPAGYCPLCDQLVNISDVTYCLGAFLGDPYPPPGFGGPPPPAGCP
jgi:hypothetical protein